MNKGFFIWAIAATLLAGFFLWRYEQKACIENVVNNIVDTAVIYIPMNGQITKKPFDFHFNQPDEKRFIIEPQLSFDPIDGITYGLGITYLKPHWSLGYSYDIVTKEHTVGFGWRF